MLYTSYLANKLVDWLLRAQAFTPPTTTLSLGLLTSTKGPRANSTVYALNDTFSLTANDGKTHLYKCTAAGTTAAAQSALYPGVNSEAIVDGTATFTEQAAAIRAGTVVEASYTGYARSNTAASLTNYAGTQGATTTVASTGILVPTTSNNTVQTFGATNTGSVAYIWGVAFFDATPAGNMLIVEPLNTVKTINNGDPAPTFAISALSLSIDS
jgi:hypothetical protein